MKNTISPTLAKKLIATQFPEYANLGVTEVDQQGHDNRTYRLGNDLLIRMPTSEAYALKVPLEHQRLPQLAKQLSIPIPAPVALGKSSALYPYPFSIYQWIDGISANLIQLDDDVLENIALDLANFLKELQAIPTSEPLVPGQHNWWRGEHVSVYDQDARKQFAQLADRIDSAAALALWERACATSWQKSPVWIHGDFAAGNILVHNQQISGIIDFGGLASGDPACDLVIAWTYLSGNARDIFMHAMDMDTPTWLRARAWALWKATYELSQLSDQNNPKVSQQLALINELL